eukprot:1534700-Heterocapsa_arctica.AAC.1
MKHLRLLSAIFILRARGLAVAPEAWHHLVTTLFPKVPRAEQPGQFRPTCLLPALMKAYLKLLFIRMRDQIEAALHAWSVGFRRSHQPAELVGFCKQFVEKSVHWCMPLYVAKLDVEKTFDSVGRDQLFNS